MALCGRGLNPRTKLLEAVSSMRGLRIWYILVVVVAAAILFAVARFDNEYNSCSPVSPFLALSYLCGVLGIYGARWRGRRARTGLWLGLLLGPLGVILACSNPVQEGWPEREGKAEGG